MCIDLINSKTKIIKGFETYKKPLEEFIITVTILLYCLSVH